MSTLVWGPTFEEMLNPNKINMDIRKKALEALKTDPLDPINLFNINFTDHNDNLSYVVIPKEITNIKANIICLLGKNFPTGSHKVGATYSVTMEKQLSGEIIPGVHTIVYPSTGNYGIGGSWTGPRMGYDTKVILPELMSEERFEKIAYYGASYIKTPGCESSVKEIYDKCWELKNSSDKTYILNQFESFGNYMFHYYVTGNTIEKISKELKEKGIGNGRSSALVSAMGSSGTIASGDRLKQLFPENKIIGLEPIQCSTLYNNGYGDHDIQGIGDKHVTWIHNVMNMDAIMCIDDIECKKILQVLTDKVGISYLKEELSLKDDAIEFLSSCFGISGICNILGAIKTAKYYEMGENDNIFTMATDNFDRYYSVMGKLTVTYGPLTKTECAVRFNSILSNAKLDYIEEGTMMNKKRWHNLKYYTWIEQQGKTIKELNDQRSQDYWMKKQEEIYEIDKNLIKSRGF